MGDVINGQPLGNFCETSNNILLSLLPMDKAKTMIQMVCSIVALPANSATDRLEIAINFFVNLNKASKAWLLAVPANLMPIAKAAVKKGFNLLLSITKKK